VHEALRSLCSSRWQLVDADQEATSRLNTVLPSRALLRGMLCAVCYMMYDSDFSTCARVNGHLCPYTYLSITTSKDGSILFDVSRLPVASPPQVSGYLARKDSLALRHATSIQQFGVTNDVQRHSHNYHRSIRCSADKIAGSELWSEQNCHVD